MALGNQLEETAKAATILPVDQLCFTFVACPLAASFAATQQDPNVRLLYHFQPVPEDEVHHALLDEPVDHLIFFDDPHGF